MKTYLRYFTEFSNFDIDTFKKKVEDYWSVPGMHGRGLWSRLRCASNIVGSTHRKCAIMWPYLGVNAISAEDGAIFFLQHMSNISKDLEQAKKDHTRGQHAKKC